MSAIVNAAASTVLTNVAPLESVIVIVPSSPPTRFPTAPVSVIVPTLPAFIIKLLSASVALLVVPEMLILAPSASPPSVVFSNIVELPKTTLSLIVIAAPTVTMLALRFVVAFAPIISNEASPVHAIASATVIVPPPVVFVRIVTGALKVTALISIAPVPEEPPIVIPEKLFCRYPISVAVRLYAPVASVPPIPIVVESAYGCNTIVELPVTLPPKAIVLLVSDIAPRSLESPTVASRAIYPSPALTVSVSFPMSVPSMVLLNHISPAPVPEFIDTVAPVSSVTALLKVIRALVVVTSPAVVRVSARAAPKITVPVVVVILPAADIVVALAAAESIVTLPVVELIVLFNVMVLSVESRFTAPSEELRAAPIVTAPV